MISFDTLFSAFIALTIFYVSSLITLLLEKKKNRRLHIRKFSFVLTVLYILLMISSYSIYRCNVLENCLLIIQKYFQPAWEYILKSKIFPFYYQVFAQEKFVPIYVVGIISLTSILTAILILGILEERNLKYTVIFGIIFVIWFFVFIQLETLISGIIYNLLFRFGFWPTFIGNALFNLGISIGLVYWMANHGE